MRSCIRQFDLCPDRRTQWAQTGQCLISRTSSRREGSCCASDVLVRDCFSRFYSFSSRTQKKEQRCFWRGWLWVEERNQCTSLLGKLGRLFVHDPQTPLPASAALVQPDNPFLKAASQCQRELTGSMDFVPPSWERQRDNLDDSVRVMRNIYAQRTTLGHSQRLTARSGPPRQK